MLVDALHKKPSIFFVSVFLLLLCLMAYTASLRVGFVLDARYVVAKNPVIKQPALYKRILTGDLFNSYKEPFSRKLQYYRPVPLASLALDYRLFRLNAWGYHLANVIIHFFNSFLVFLLIVEIFREEKLAILCSAIFCIMPVQEWVVNYIV